MNEHESLHPLGDQEGTGRPGTLPWGHSAGFTWNVSKAVMWFSLMIRSGFCGSVRRKAQKWASDKKWIRIQSLLCKSHEKTGWEILTRGRIWSASIPADSESPLLEVDFAVFVDIEENLTVRCHGLASLPQYAEGLKKTRLWQYSGIVVVFYPARYSWTMATHSVSWNRCGRYYI